MLIDLYRQRWINIESNWRCIACWSSVSVLYSFFTISTIHKELQLSPMGLTQCRQGQATASTETCTEGNLLSFIETSKIKVPVAPTLEARHLSSQSIGVKYTKVHEYGFPGSGVTWIPVQLNSIESGSWLAICAMCLRTSFFVIMPNNLPLCVTRHWRRPSLRKMSITISMGVWSVMVKGLRSIILRSFKLGGAVGGCGGVCSVK